MTLVVAVFALAAIAGAAWPTSGVVVDTRGKPVGGANVYAFLGDTPHAKRTLIHTDPKGAFAFKSPAPGKYWYLVDAKGYGYSIAYERDPDPNAKITIKLWPAKKITGRVVDQAGKPVPGATVSIEFFEAVNAPSDMINGTAPLVFFIDQPAFIGSVKTDNRGKFALGHVPDPSGFKEMYFSLSAIAPGRARAAKLYYGKPQLPTSLKIVSPPACALAGTVFLPGKSGVAPRDVGLMLHYDRLGGPPEERVVLLDKNGKFAFKDLPPGPVTIKVINPTPEQTGPLGEPVIANPPDWVLPRMPKVVLAPGQPKNLELELARGALIKGKVVDKAAGKPATGGGVSIAPAGAREDETTSAEIDKQGEFTARVAPGDLKITVLYAEIDGKYVSGFSFEGEEEGPMSRNITVADGEEKTDIVFQIEPEQAREEAYLYLGSAQPLPPDFQITPGTYKLTWDPNAPGSENPSYDAQNCSGDQAKAKMAKLPELKSKKPYYMCVAIDSATDLLDCIFDQSNAAGKGYDTLYVDANRNGDLTDDQPVTWRLAAGSGYTPWVEVQAHQGSGDARTSNPVKVRWRMNAGSPMEMERRGAWKGTLDTSKGPAKVILIDHNGNGVYNDPVVGDSANAGRPPFGDRIAFKLGGDSGLPFDWQGLTQDAPNVLGGKAYIFCANSTGGELTVKPYTGPMGKLVVGKIDLGGHGGRLASMSMSGKNGDVEYRDLTGKPLILPVGDYTIEILSLNIVTGRKTIEVSGSLNRPVHIKPNECVVLDIIGKPRLKIVSNGDDWVLKPGTEQRVDWNYDFGDVLKGASIYSSAGSSATAKARFDTSRKSIPVSYKPGGG